ncbi:hypothetical protein [Ectobacillus sp. sgz5001026]|uniref:hypothetical protein n=1 Tax=Ectobacillus sp. sgz5001026 TaxID=3242473 RepID=UPI0036D29BC6
MYDLYMLYNHGISLNQIRNLVNQEITIKDFLSHAEKVHPMINKKPKLYYDIMKILDDANFNYEKECVAQLAHVGLSPNIIDNLINLNIAYSDIPNLTLEVFNEKNGANKQSTFNKIQAAYNTFELKKGNVPYNLVKQNVEDILSSMSSKASTTFNEILKEVPYTLENDTLDKIIKEFHDKKYIKCDSQGVIIRQYPHLAEYMKKDFVNKEIFISFLSGVSATELAENHQYSRQGIYNILNRILNNNPTFEEDIKYSAVFEKFNISNSLFCTLYNEEGYVYLYLDLKYKRGKKSLLDEIFNSRFNDAQRKIILRHYNCFIDRKGDIKELSKNNIFEEIIPFYALNALNDSMILDKFNEYIIKRNLPSSLLSDEVSIRGLSNRCPNIIRGNSNAYRYYDFDIITPGILYTLNSLLQLEPGIYSMRKIFKENQDLMEEIDIRTEYELHNLYKLQVQKDDVNYTRMPEFSVGHITKKDFLLLLFREYAPVELDELLEFVEEVWGIRADSTRSFILSQLHKYIDGDMIKLDYNLLSSNDIFNLSLLLREPLYTVQEVLKIGKSIRTDFPEDFINNMNLSKLDYTLRSNYILKNDYNSVDQYFRSMILSKDYFYNEHLPIYGTQSFGTVVYDLEKNHDIFKVEKDVYMTYNKFSQAQMSKDDITNYKNAILTFVNSTDYFTLYALQQKGFSHYLEDLGFTNDFYNRLIWTFDEIGTIQTSEGYIFRITNETISLKNFLFDLILQMRKIDIYDFLDTIQNTYGIILEKSKVVYLLRDTDIYYSEELYRFYADKEDYYEEVYDQ